MNDRKQSLITLCCVVEYYRRCPVSYWITNVMWRWSVPTSRLVVSNYNVTGKPTALIFPEDGSSIFPRNHINYDITHNITFRTAEWTVKCLQSWNRVYLKLIVTAMRANERNILILALKPLQAKHRPLYLKTQSVPRCKHFSYRL
jgi:hypothetical protein